MPGFQYAKYTHSLVCQSPPCSSVARGPDPCAEIRELTSHLSGARMFSSHARDKRKLHIAQYASSFRLRNSDDLPFTERIIQSLVKW